MEKLINSVTTQINQQEAKRKLQGQIRGCVKILTHPLSVVKLIAT